MSGSIGERWYRVVTPSVVSEIIDGEAVIMDLRSGHYFSTRDTGALIWDWLDKGHSDRQATARLAALCGIDTAAAGAAVNGFVSEIVERELRSAERGTPGGGGG